MLELLTAGVSNAQGPAWDGTIPAASANTIFRMADFLTTADIKDKGPNSIGVTNTSVVVGSNSLGTYMDFNGNGYLTLATSSFFNLPSLDMTFIMGDIQYPGGQYGYSFLDGRPVNTNGRYLTFSTPVASPLKVSFSYNSVNVGTTDTIISTPVKIDIKLRPSEVTIYANGGGIRTFGGSYTFNNQQYKIGRNAFAVSGGVPNLKAKIYYIEFKSV